MRVLLTNGLIFDIKACFSNYGTLYEQFFRRLRDVGERDVVFALLTQADKLARYYGICTHITKHLNRATAAIYPVCFFLMRKRLFPFLPL